MLIILNYLYKIWTLLLYLYRLRSASNHHYPVHGPGAGAGGESEKIPAIKRKAQTQLIFPKKTKHQNLIIDKIA